MDFHEWEVLYQGYGYFLQTFYDEERKTFRVNIQRSKAHADDRVYFIYDYDKNGDPIEASSIFLPEFKTFQEAIQDFAKERIWDNNAKTFWEVQDPMERRNESATSISLTAKRSIRRERPSISSRDELAFPSFLHPHLLLRTQGLISARFRFSGGDLLGFEWNPPFLEKRGGAIG